MALAAALAYGQLQPQNDLFAIGQGTGDSPPEVQVSQPPEPPLEATPLVPCGPGSHEQPGVDGRVPAGSAKDGLNCNIQLVGHQGTEGGFKVFRYVDAQGQQCAFYDTTLMFPLNAFNPGGGSIGVAVLDMSDPAHPKQTDTLTTPPMLSPHESVNLNTRRGLLAAVNGNLTTEPGVVAIYDVHDNCQHPVLKSLTHVARFGHESGFAPDGKTFYATSTALRSITAIDVTDPSSPHAIWHGNVFSHGMTVSNDGKRAYIADPGTVSATNPNKANMLILDISQIQARKSDPHAKEISRTTWSSASIPQNAIPFTHEGHPYVLEFDEYDQSTLRPDGDPDVVGAGRILDVADEAHPRVISNLRLAVDQPAEHKAAAGDPGGSGAPQGYAAHYCNIPTRVNPTVVACSFITSGLRVFDISDLLHPKEIAYYVAPPQTRSENGNEASDFAMSQPAFDPKGREIWWTDGTSGFYALRVDESVWPTGATSSAQAEAAVSGLRIVPSSFPAARRGGSVVRSARRPGARVSYRDNQPAATTFTVLKRVRGVRRGSRCVRPRGRRTGGTRCARYVRVGSFRRTDRAGANRFRFTGRVRGRRLPPGRYRLRAVPRFDGQNGLAVTRPFRIVRR